MFCILGLRVSTTLSFLFGFLVALVPLPCTSFLSFLFGFGDAVLAWEAGLVGVSLGVMVGSGVSSLARLLLGLDFDDADASLDYTLLAVFGGAWLTLASVESADLLPALEVALVTVGILLNLDDLNLALQFWILK